MAQPAHNPPHGSVLVLGGGGSLGAAQVGVLRAFYRAGFRPAAIVETSVGAINGAFLAFHVGPDGPDLLKEAWLSPAVRQIFSANPVGLVRNFLAHRNCLFDNGTLRRLLTRYLPADDFGILRIPFYAVATNLTRGTKTVFHQGPIYRAVLASTAIPGVLCPVTIDGDIYVDGGILAGLDLETAVQLGARDILAVDVSQCEAGSLQWDVFHIWRRANELAAREQVQRDLERFSPRANIVCIRPPCALDVSPQDFTRSARLMEEAEAYGESLAPALLDANGQLLAATPRRPAAWSWIRGLAWRASTDSLKAKLYHS